MKKDLNLKNETKNGCRITQSARLQLRLQLPNLARICLKEMSMYIETVKYCIYSIVRVCSKFGLRGVVVNYQKFFPSLENISKGCGLN